jgi:hypothetical protein
MESSRRRLSSEVETYAARLGLVARVCQYDFRHIEARSNYSRGSRQDALIGFANKWTKPAAGSIRVRLMRHFANTLRVSANRCCGLVKVLVVSGQETARDETHGIRDLPQNRRWAGAF